MKYLRNLSSVMLICFAAIGCSQNRSPNSESEIVKIVETRTYEAKPHFDKLIPGEPVYNYQLRPINDFEEDFSWTIKSYDRFNSVVKEQKFKLDNNNNIKIWSTTINEYYDSQESKLSKVKKENYTSSHDLYIRDSAGSLIEIQSYNSKSELSEKKLFKYNDLGQRILEEVYNENGLQEKTQYFYYENNPSEEPSKVIHTVKNEKYDYKSIFEYKLNTKSQPVEIHQIYYETGVLRKDVVHYYEYISNGNSERIIETTKGFDNSFEYDQSGSQVNSEKKISTSTSTTEIIRNEHGDIIEYLEYSTRDFPSNHLVGEYSYNEYNDWIELVFTQKITGNSYIVKRNIQYID